MRPGQVIDANILDAGSLSEKRNFSIVRRGSGGWLMLGAILAVLQVACGGISTSEMAAGSTGDGAHVQRQNQSQTRCQIFRSRFTPDPIPWADQKSISPTFEVSRWCLIFGLAYALPAALKCRICRSSTTSFKTGP